MKRNKLLKELEKHGIHPSGRKVRSDKNKTHKMTAVERKPRSDIGSKRSTYNKRSPEFNKKIFNTLIASNFKDGEDLLQRDDNGIFPPQITHYYKRVYKTSGGYRSSTRRSNHPEQLRWKWWMSEYENSTGNTKKQWATRIQNWYFIEEADILLWSYEEWAWAYFTQIGGVLNSQLSDNFIKLYYNSYLKGDYGRPKRDKNDYIIWER